MDELNTRDATVVNAGKVVKVTKAITKAANDMTYTELDTLNALNALHAPNGPNGPKALNVPGDYLPQISQWLDSLALEKEHAQQWQRWEQGFVNDWLKEAKHERKVQAAQKMNAKIAGQDKAQLSKANLRKACEWVFEFGWSSPSIINLLLDRQGSFTSRYCTHNKPPSLGGNSKTQKDSAFSPKRDKYFVCTPTSAGSYQADFPKSTITLANKGLDLALEKYAGFEYPELKKDKIPTGKRGTDLRHSALIQKTAIYFLRYDQRVQFTSERMYFEKNEAGVKKPDGILVLPGGWVVCLEMELSNKGGASFFKFVKDVYTALLHNKMHYVVFFTDSTAIYQKYYSALRGIAQVPEYEKANGKTRRIPGGSFRMPTEFAARIFVNTIDPKYPQVAVNRFLGEFYESGIPKVAPKLEDLTAKHWEDELTRLEFLEDWKP